MSVSLKVKDGDLSLTSTGSFETISNKELLRQHVLQTIYEALSIGFIKGLNEESSQFFESLLSLRLMTFLSDLKNVMNSNLVSREYGERITSVGPVIIKISRDKPTDIRFFVRVSGSGQEDFTGGLS